MVVSGDEDDWSRIDMTRFALYGGSITLVMDFVLYPLEVLKTKMMIDTKVCGRSSSLSVLPSQLHT
jgi:uncharacterized membrane protein YagU involved in acid resistance